MEGLCSWWHQEMQLQSVAWVLVHIEQMMCSWYQLCDPRRYRELQGVLQGAIPD